MKALTLTEPWAKLVAIGAKRIETRSWTTRYRGPLAIHAAKGFPTDAQMLCLREPFYSVLGPEIWPNHTLTLPRGVVVALAQLVDVLPTESVIAKVSDQELVFGDYSAGRFAWILEEVDELVSPVPARGSLGLWDWAGQP